MVDQGEGIRVVSACLAGIACRYDGKRCAHPAVVSLLKAGRAVPLCPEQLAGLPTPRESVALVGGDGEAVLRGDAKVVACSGRDLTQSFLAGAEEVLKVARLVGCREVLFQERSPSCGVEWVYQGKDLVRGWGVCTAVLERAGFSVRGMDGSA